MCGEAAALGRHGISRRSERDTVAARAEASRPGATAPRSAFGDGARRLGAPRQGWGQIGGTALSVCGRRSRPTARTARGPPR
jgi:hypothetical protein